MVQLTNREYEVYGILGKSSRLSIPTTTKIL